MKKNREILQKLLEMDTTQLEVLQLAMEENPFLKESEKEVFKGMLAFFQKYPLEDYRLCIKKAYLLKIKRKYYTPSNSLMETDREGIKSWIPKDHPLYLKTLKHEFVHWMNPNLPFVYRNAFNEGLTNLIMMDTYHIPLSQIHYMHITIFMMMMSRIYGLKNWIQTYQGKDVYKIMDEMERVLGKEDLDYLQVASGFVNEIEYVKMSILEEAHNWGYLSGEHQSEYLSYDLESQKIKMKVWKLVSKLYQAHHDRPIEFDSKMIQCFDLYLKDILTIQKKENPYLKQIEKVLRK